MIRKRQSPPDIYTRLKQRGVEYEHVFHIVQFDVPQIPFFFARHFGNRTLKKVLKHIESWKQFLNKEFLLTEELKAELTRWVKKTEALVWDTIRDTNYQIDEWTLYWVSTPPREAPDGKHIMSGWMVTATNQKTSEQRKYELMGCGRGILRAYGQDYPATYRALGLFDQLWLKAPGPFLISGRASQGWPVYARMIPRLYELLAPHYQDERGRYSEKIDLEGTVIRPARYPKGLLEDMLEILRMHHTGVFEKMTSNQLKAAIQRHLDGKSTQASPAP